MIGIVRAAGVALVAALALTVFQPPMRSAASSR